MNSSLLSSSRSSITALGLILGLVCTMMSGCESLGKTVGQKELVPPDHVRLMHSERHCRETDISAASPFPNADHVESVIYGSSRLLRLSGSEWEWKARQIAVERDADLSLMRPCDGGESASSAFKFVQIEVWRTRGFTAPTLQDEPRPESGTLMAPSRTTYGTRLQNIFECFEQARVSNGPVTTENKQRIGKIDATDFFTPDAYFTGYARIDRYYRPTRTGALSLSGILLDRGKADWASGVYLRLSKEEKTHFADRYLVCLLDRGYGLWSLDSSNNAPQSTPKSGAAELRR